MRLQVMPSIALLAAWLAATLVFVANSATHAAVPLPPAFAVRASTSSGVVEGVRVQDVVSFKGIPYATPPVGDLRWRGPQRVPTWQGVRKADAFGQACIQKPGLSLENGGDPGPLNEDCLYLNIWTPQADAAAKLPVMVWIHGGALIFGGGSLALYDGAALAARGAVIVTIGGF